MTPKPRARHGADSPLESSEEHLAPDSIVTWARNGEKPGGQEAKFRPGGQKEHGLNRPKIISFLTACFSYPDMKSSTRLSFSKSTPFQASELCPQLKKQPAELAPSQFRGPPLPPWCSRMSLINSA